MSAYWSNTTAKKTEFHPFVFTGKEKDAETGYGYFGARYMDHELMTSWLSVDPMADKYPSISPYAYCAWNPIKLVDPDGNEIDDYYNLKGELIHSTNEGNNKYLVITNGKDLLKDMTIAVPTTKTLTKMEQMYTYNGQLKEKGIIVEPDGNSSSMVTGSKYRISKEQWQPATNEIKERNSTIDHLVHLHVADFATLEIGAPDPSDPDRNSDNFYNSRLGVILSFVQPMDPNRKGQSTNEKDYRKNISFYNETSEKAIYSMSFREFKRVVNKINKNER